MSDQEISAIRASCRNHNGSYRRKLRKLYSESPAAAQIIDNQVKNGFLTEQEFQILNVENKKRNNNEPYLYNVNWAQTTERPESFIGCESSLKKFVPEFRNKTESEIRQELVNQVNFNESLKDDKEYEEIVIPKIRKN